MRNRVEKTKPILSFCVLRAAKRDLKKQSQSQKLAQTASKAKVKSKKEKCETKPIPYVVLRIA
jgi:hypothetical protein